MDPFRLVMSRKPTTRPQEFKHKFGGYPDGIPANERPRCPHCRAPLILICQLDSSDPALSSFSFQPPLVYFFDCWGCAVTCYPMLYRIDDGRFETVYIDPDSEKWASTPPKGILPERSARLEPLTKEQAKEARSHIRRDAGYGKCHLFGITPVWLQRSQTPECTVCGKKMKCIGQIDSDHSEKLDWKKEKFLAFGDMGFMYALYCKGCQVFGVVEQGC